MAEPENTEVEIEITDLEAPENETPEVVVETAPEPDPTPPAAPESVDTGIQTLKAQLEAEQRSRADAERRAREATAVAQQSRSEAKDAQINLLGSAIEQINQHNAILKARYRDAMANQQYDDVADIQLEMGTNAARLLELERGKTALENAPREQPQKQQYTADPVEALAAQLSPRSAAWVRSHPEFATNQSKYGAMLAAHNLAVANGLQPDTDEYFTEIEQSLRIRKPEAAPAVEHVRASAPPAAPVSRGSTSTGSSPNRVRLSAEEREMAAAMQMTVQEYAKHKLAIERGNRHH